ncbi:MAG: ROK family protein, partial [Bacteroidaceae bacterium]
MYKQDKRIVMTLDAGGTNFVFSALQGYHEIIEPICLSAASDDLERCLAILLEGFTKVKDQLQKPPAAISFAFPGPADYEHGIIGDLPNFPAFRGGVALGPFLKEQFKIPVFINNDGNLFAYGEALAGKLPEINARLEATGSNKRYKNLIGLTLGTGFGAGVVINNQLLTGDNGCGGDVWIMRNKKYPEMIAEESVSTRAVKRVYQEISKTDASTLTPKDIFDIAEGNRSGNKQAAIKSFH